MRGRGWQTRRKLVGFNPVSTVVTSGAGPLPAHLGYRDEKTVSVPGAHVCSRSRQTFIHLFINMYQVLSAGHQGCGTSKIHLSPA